MIHFKMNKEAKVFAKMLSANKTRNYTQIAHCAIVDKIMTITATDTYSLVQLKIKDVDSEDRVFCLPASAFKHMAAKKVNTLSLDRNDLFGGVFSLDLEKAGMIEAQYPDFKKVIPDVQRVEKLIGSKYIEAFSDLDETMAICKVKGDEHFALQNDRWFYLLCLMVK